MKTSEKLLNEKRREILFNLDRNETYSNIHLDMYDLSAYLTDFKFDSSLAEKIIEFKRETDERIITHIEGEDKKSFMRHQLQALQFIFGNKRSIISAPTSFGKTMIIKEYIFRAQPNSVVVIVPTNALAYELEKTFKENSNFSNYEIYDSILEDVNSEGNQSGNRLFIGTQEKYLEVFKEKELTIDLFVIDEAYKLEESVRKSRSYKLSLTFLDSISDMSNKIVLLSPNAKFIGFERYEFNIYSTYFNAVEKDFIICNETEFYKLLKNESEINKTILFCQSPNTISKLYDKLSLEYDVRINNSNKEIENLIKTIKSDIHPEWSVVKYLEKGILIHHGQMPKYIQNKIQRLYIEDCDLNLIIGTNSLSEGINTPTKNLFINPDYRIEENKFLIKNTVGRAGRLGQYPVGRIFSLQNCQELLEEEIEIKLALEEDEAREEIIDITNDDEIGMVVEEFGLPADVVRKIIKKFSISLPKLKRLLIELKKPTREQADITELLKISKNVFNEEKSYISNEERLYMKGMLNYFYVIPIGSRSNRKRLDTFSDKIKFFREKAPKSKKSISEIIEGYLKMQYSTLEHHINPIVFIAKMIEEEVPEWGFGEDVMRIILEYLKKYQTKILGIDEFFQLEENQRKILLTIRSYGISLTGVRDIRALIQEIENRLNIRYSTYDILNTIKNISKERDNELSSACKNIVQQYI